MFSFVAKTSFFRKPQWIKRTSDLEVIRDISTTQFLHPKIRKAWKKGQKIIKTGRIEFRVEVWSIFF